MGDEYEKRIICILSLFVIVSFAAYNNTDSADNQTSVVSESETITETTTHMLDERRK